LKNQARGTNDKTNKRKREEVGAGTDEADTNEASPADKKRRGLVKGPRATTVSAHLSRLPIQFINIAIEMNDVHNV
jgi:hypothetical protein